MVRDRGTGKYRRTRLFVLTLGYSRKSVRLLVWRSSAQTWAELHERAFRRLGGTVDEAAALLRTTRRAIYAMVERRQLPGVVRLGRRVLVRAHDLLHWLDQKCAPSPEE
jgi:excisionase family DNA binding protein